MLYIILVIIVVGVLLYVADLKLKPVMDNVVYRILQGVVILCLVLWLAAQFGLLPIGPVPRVR